MTNILALDVGTKRIGVAVADPIVPVATPVVTLAVDGSEIEAIRQLIDERDVDMVVVGYPRNQSGEPTAQTAHTEAFAEQLRPHVTIVYQDESLTSVMAEERLKKRGKPYQKEDIDAEAAAIILQDYMEAHHVA